MEPPGAGQLSNLDRDAINQNVTLIRRDRAELPHACREIRERLVYRRSAVMKHRLGLVMALLPGLAFPRGAAAQPIWQLAPADEYFGRARMSPLEITNRIRDAEVRGPSYRGLVNTQAALEDWTRKYPRDPWIASREYRLWHLFARLRSRDGNAEAVHCRAFMRAHFPRAFPVKI